MKILQMIDSLEWGGAQKMQVFLAESLCPLGVEVAVASLSEQSNSPIQAELEALGVKVYTFPFAHLLSPRSFDRLLKHIRDEQYDLIHTHRSQANLIGTLAGMLTGVPVIATQRPASAEKGLTRTPRYILENWVVRRGARRIMGSGWASAEFASKRFAPRQIDILPNAVDLIPAVDPAERKALRAELVKDPNRPLILSVGRLSPPKGFSTLLDAFAMLREKHPEAALAIAGEGSLRASLEKHITHLGLDGQVFLLGARMDVPRLLAASDIYANSSLREGLPVSVLEAMAAGLPVVATAVGDTQRVLSHGTGIVVPPKSAEKLHAALADLLEHPAKRQSLGRAAQAHIARDYTRKGWIRGLLSLYAKVTPAAKPLLDALP